MKSNNDIMHVKSRVKSNNDDFALLGKALSSMNRTREPPVNMNGE